MEQKKNAIINRKKATCYKAPERKLFRETANYSSGFENGTVFSKYFYLESRIVFVFSIIALHTLM